MGTVLMTRYANLYRFKACQSYAESIEHFVVMEYFYGTR